MNHLPWNHQPARRRTGFTLVELLVVILIIAILIALLVPAIAAAVRKANDARVSSEINAMATSLADFKNEYGDYPPSRIMLPTQNTNGGLAIIIGTPAYASVIWNPGNLADISYRDLASRSQRALLKYFPRANDPKAFNIPGVGPFVILQGHECLVFFLGGMPLYDGTTNTYAMKGFSKDPTSPLSTTGTNRTQPLYEFPSARLQDVYSTPITDPAQGGVFSNGFPSFIDPLGSGNSDARPYSYFSAYGGNGYDPNDDNYMGLGNYNGGSLASDSVELDDSQTNLVFRTFHTIFPNAAGANIVGSYGPNPYTSTDPLSNTATYINPQSFQLMSAGRDRQWGLGGAYTPNSNTTKLPVAGTDPSTFTSLRIRERDNLTNFSTGAID